MPGWMFWVVGVLLMVLEGAVLAGFGVARGPHLALALTVYLGTQRDFAPGALTLAALMLPAEWFAGGVTGVYSLGLLGVFVGAQLIRPRLDRRWSLLHVAVAAAAILTHHMILTALWLITQPRLSAAVFWTTPRALLWGVLGAAAVGALLDRIDRAMDPRRGQDGLAGLG